jgi:tetratricopeptide (TPR) repeat protein
MAGRLSESERDARERVSLARSLDDAVSLFHALRDLGWILGHQGRYAEADRSFSDALEIAQGLGSHHVVLVGSVLGFWGAVLVRQGRFDQADAHLTESLAIKERIGDTPGMLEPLLWLGRLHEIQETLDEAHAYYRRCLELEWLGLRYFHCEALAGLVRVTYAQGQYDAVPPLAAEVEALARQHEYNDHLTALRLTQGHAALDGQDGHVPEWGAGFDAALSHYQQALIYALRYNRFLLDEVLWGGGVTTPLRPIAPHCLARGESGRRMLAALRDWWATGTNATGTPNPDTISPIPEGIPLPEAERLARQREPGDRSPQLSVVERLKKEASNQFDA